MDARYSRQLVLPGFGAPAQARLEQARVLVIGAGGLGSAVLPALAAAGVGTIGVIDDDLVELSNLHRQTIHGTEDVGNYKTTSAIESMRAINPAVRVEPVEARLSAENALALFAQYDLIVDGSDNFATRYLAADAATITQKPVVWGAVSKYGGQASVAMPGGPGYRDLFPVPGTAESCEVGGVLPTTVAVIGSIMATEVLKVLTGVGEPLAGRVTTYDALTGRFREIAFAASAEPVTELIDYELFCGVSTGSTRSIAGASLLDVRETWEAEIASLPGALLVPLASLPDVIESLDPQEDWVVYCHHGIRSQQAVDYMRQRGFEQVRSLEGGIDAWARANDPTMARY